MAVRPTIGAWYKNLEDGSLFEVVAYDEDDGTIEVQHFESEIEEFDMDSWEEMPLEATSEPEDWSGPFDDLVQDDMGDTENIRTPENWSGPINEFD
ncbi:MAG: hypothetical protein OEZ39_12775 [Gammaproteobacteria bacterium]|nr:hypothetical protein [Gammaproteobacteria bacterium]MDH5652721.1 hypothetical protein [Gammaproteobacteria bacterium]